MGARGPFTVIETLKLGCYHSDDSDNTAESCVPGTTIFGTGGGYPHPVEVGYLLSDTLAATSNSQLGFTRTTGGHNTSRTKV